jgi:hypothetical protein
MMSEGEGMDSIPVDQAVDVHWHLPTALKPEGTISGDEHICKFIGLIAAARFAVEKAAEGNLNVNLYLAIGPALNSTQAQRIVTLSEVQAIKGRAIPLAQLKASNDE